MNRRVHVAKSPLVGGQLPVGMHVPFAQKKNELLFGKIRIDQRKRNAVKRQIPRGIPRILPFVGHGNNVVVVKMRPVLVAAVPSAVRRLRTRRIAFEPRAHVVVIKLFGPEHA